MAVLVTGAAGFIGSHVAEALLHAGREVVALDDLSGGFVENVPQGAVFVRGSILDAPLLSRIFAEHRITDVFHLAAHAAEGLSHFIRRFTYTANIVGSVNVINEAIKADVGCFVFTSSIAVYGASQVPMHEGLVPEPEDPYGIAKYAIEMDLRAAGRHFGLDWIVFRPHNVYGERQHIGDRHRNVVGIFLRQALGGEPLTIFGDGTQTRAFSYIGDVAPLVARSIDTPGARNQVFNVGADTAVTVNDLAAMVARAAGRDLRVTHLPPRHEVLHAVADHARLAQVFGYRPRWTLPEGLRRMAAWAQQVGPREPRPAPPFEVTRNVPGAWL